MGSAARSLSPHESSDINRHPRALKNATRRTKKKICRDHPTAADLDESPSAAKIKGRDGLTHPPAKGDVAVGGRERRKNHRGKRLTLSKPLCGAAGQQHQKDKKGVPVYLPLHVAVQGRRTGSSLLFGWNSGLLLLTRAPGHLGVIAPGSNAACRSTPRGCEA
jgi:hypothetical protein